MEKGTLVVMARAARGAAKRRLSDAAKLARAPASSSKKLLVETVKTARGYGGVLPRLDQVH